MPKIHNFGAGPAKLPEEVSIVNDTQLFKMGCKWLIKYKYIF